MKSISDSESARREYGQLIAAIAADYPEWDDVPMKQRHALYDLRLCIDGPGDAWAAATNHDEERGGEGGSAMWAFRQALQANSMPGELLYTPWTERLAARLIMNLEAYYSERIQADIEQEKAEIRAEASPPWSIGAHMKRVYRDLAERARELGA